MDNKAQKEEEDVDAVYFRLKLYRSCLSSAPHFNRLYHPPSAQDLIPDYMTFVAYITLAMTRHQGLFGSAVDISVIHCLGTECWIRVHKESNAFQTSTNEQGQEESMGSLELLDKRPRRRPRRDILGNCSNLRVKGYNLRRNKGIS